MRCHRRANAEAPTGAPMGHPARHRTLRGSTSRGERFIAASAAPPPEHLLHPALRGLGASRLRAKPRCDAPLRRLAPPAQPRPRP